MPTGAAPRIDESPLHSVRPRCVLAAAGCSHDVRAAGSGAGVCVARGTPHLYGWPHNFFEGGPCTCATHRCEACADVRPACALGMRHREMRDRDETRLAETERRGVHRTYTIHKRAATLLQTPTWTSDTRHGPPTFLGVAGTQTRTLPETGRRAAAHSATPHKRAPGAAQWVGAGGSAPGSNTSCRLLARWCANDRRRTCWRRAATALPAAGCGSSDGGDGVGCSRCGGGGPPGRPSCAVSRRQRAPPRTRCTWRRARRVRGARARASRSASCAPSPRAAPWP